MLRDRKLPCFVRLDLQRAALVAELGTLHLSKADGRRFFLRAPGPIIRGNLICELALGNIHGAALALRQQEGLIVDKDRRRALIVVYQEKTSFRWADQADPGP